MSEYLQNDNTEELAPDDVLASLDDQYVQYDPQPKLLNPIFEKLREDQLKFAIERRYKTLEQAVMVGEGYVGHINERLVEIGRKGNENLMGEVASLTGTGIISTRTTADFFSAESALTPMVAGDEAAEFKAQMSGVQGYFRGISFLIGNTDPYAQNNNGASEEATYYVRLHYLVQYGTSNSPFGLLPIAAIGEVGVSELAFFEDTQYQAIHNALDQLLLNDSMEIASHVNDLNQVLSTSRLSGVKLRKISELTAKLHAYNELSVKDSEAILELITAYIRPSGYPYKIRATDAVCYPHENQGNECYLVKGVKGSPLEYDQEPSDIILAPGYVVGNNLQDDMELESTEIVPYFVIEQDDAVLHVPMNHVRAFGPGTY